jgi:hypothetical protein
MSTIQCSISSAELAEMRQNEAVLLTVWESDAGDWWSEYTASGSLADMEAEANRTKLVIVPTGIKSITSDVVLVRDLIPPDEETRG